MFRTEAAGTDGASAFVHRAAARGVRACRGGDQCGEGMGRVIVFSVYAQRHEGSPKL